MPMSKPQRAAIYPRLHSTENMEEHKDRATLTLQNPQTNDMNMWNILKDLQSKFEALAVKAIGYR